METIDLQSFADYHGLDTRRAGEVLITALHDSDMSGFITAGQIQRLGVEETDTKAEVVKKIQSALNSADSSEIIRQLFGDETSASEEDVLIVDCIRDDLFTVLNWLKTID